MRQDLPDAAREHPEWPIRLDHCFGRVILDAVCGHPWRESVSAPAWRHLSEDQLEAAIALADAVLAGAADLHALNAASREMRRRARAGASPCPGATDLLARLGLQGTRPVKARRT